MTTAVARTSVLVAALLAAPAAHADDTLVQLELDPLPFATGGYGTQIGIRPPALRGLRVSVASFAVNVPDVVTELHGNEGWELRVRPSLATYVLYYFAAPGEDGITVGGAVRYLRQRFRHDHAPDDEALVRDVSPEAIVGYQWHPFGNGFYLQPWLGLSVVLHRRGEAAVGGRTFDPFPVQPFFTVNVGYEHRL